MNLILCGYKSSGKTTVGQAYARTYDYQFIDTDDQMMQAFQAAENPCHTISDVYSALGATAFRTLEANIIQQITPSTRTVIATGGGAVMAPESAQHLRSLGTVIYLYIEHAALYDRLLQSPKTPRFIDKNNKADDLKKYVTSRHDAYQTIAQYTVNTTGKSIPDIVSEVHNLMDTRC